MLVFNYQTTIIIVNCLVQGRNNVIRMQVELRSYNQGPCKNDAFTFWPRYPLLNQARRQRGGRGAMRPRIFLGGRILGGKNVKICDFGQKKPSDFGEDLFFFFGDHLFLVGKFVI